MKYKTLEEFEAAVEAITDGGHAYPASWCIGGQSGGSCYDEGEPSYYAIETDPEPEDEYLDKILEDAFPLLSFLEYKKLLRAEIYERTEKHNNEYYGNYSVYAKRLLKVDVLFKALVDVASCR